MAVVFFALLEVATFTVYCKKSVNGDDFMVVQLGRLERCRQGRGLGVASNGNCDGK